MLPSVKVIVLLFVCFIYVLNYGTASFESANTRNSSHYIDSINTTVAHPTKLFEVTNSRYINRNSHHGTRVGIIVIYTGISWPNWFQAFLFTIQHSSSMFDWLFILPYDNSPPLVDMPSNVRIFRLSLSELAERLISIESRYPRYPDTVDTHAVKDRMIKTMYKLILTQPYTLVEFKPCFGYLFHDILNDYSHWAYADIDMLIGNMDKLIPVEALKEYDIITVSFGDPYIFYLRGQLTIHRNRLDINMIWKQCAHYTTIYDRLIDYEASNESKWNFVSAEGCYSDAVIRGSTVNLFVSTSQLSTAFTARLELRESFMLGNSIIQCNTQPIYDTDNDRISEFMLEDQYTGRFASDKFYQYRDYQPLTIKKYKCIYRNWFDKKYEICLDLLPVDADVMRVNSTIMRADDPRRNVMNTCKEGSMFHFVFWKKHYYAHTTRSPSPDTHLVLITDTGFIPYRLPMSLNNVSYEHLTINAADQLTSFGTLNTRSSLNPTHATSYCLSFSNDMRSCICPLIYDQINIKSSSASGILKSKHDITLVTIGWISDVMTDSEGPIHKLLKAWDDLKIVVLAIDSSHPTISHDIISAMLAQYHPLIIVIVDINCQTHHSIRSNSHYSHLEASILPDNLLYNTALDLLTTPMVVIVPPGFQLHVSHTSTNRLAYSIIQQLSSSHMRNRAMVIPSYHIDIISSNNISYHPFPSSKIQQGHDQPSMLKVDFNEVTSASYKSDELSCKKPQDMLNEKTFMLPIAFNRATTQHGTAFVRFPEELSGMGCYGTSILRILCGAGYELQFSSQLYATYNTYPVSTTPAIAVEHDNGCISANMNINATKIMMNKFNMYYARADNLRRYGIRDLYTRRPYGFIFEKHQRDRLKKRASSK